MYFIIYIVTETSYNIRHTIPFHSVLKTLSEDPEWGIVSFSIEDQSDWIQWGGTRLSTGVVTGVGNLQKTLKGKIETKNMNCNFDNLFMIVSESIGEIGNSIYKEYGFIIPFHCALQQGLRDVVVNYVINGDIEGLYYDEYLHTLWELDPESIELHLISQKE